MVVSVLALFQHDRVVSGVDGPATCGVELARDSGFGGLRGVRRMERRNMLAIAVNSFLLCPLQLSRMLI